MLGNYAKGDVYYEAEVQNNQRQGAMISSHLYGFVKNLVQLFSSRIRSRAMGRWWRLPIPLVDTATCPAPLNWGAGLRSSCLSIDFSY